MKRFRLQSGCKNSEASVPRKWEGTPSPIKQRGKSIVYTPKLDKWRQKTSKWSELHVKFQRFWPPHTHLAFRSLCLIRGIHPSIICPQINTDCRHCKYLLTPVHRARRQDGALWIDWQASTRGCGYVLVTRSRQTERERERESSQVLFPYLQELHFARCYLLSNFPVSHFSFTQFLSLLFETSCFQQEHQSLYLLQTILISLPTLPFSFPSFPFIFTYPSPFLFKLLASYGCGSSGLVVSC